MKKTVISELNGRLGNQMFIYAFCRALSLDLGATPILYDGLIKNSKIDYRLSCFNLCDEIKCSSTWPATIFHRLGLVINAFLTDKVSRVSRLRIQRFLNPFLQGCGLFICNEGYTRPILSFLKKRTVFTIGYFQSEKFFLTHRTQIIQDFSFREEIVNRCADWRQIIRNSTTPVCIHIRLGDYLQFPEFYICTFDYYKKAIDSLLEVCPSATFFVFSDSPDIVAQNIVIPNSVFIPSDYNDQESLYLGSLCKHHIISNSSFSWWMQYLAYRDGQIVFAPSRWMNDGDYSAIYQKHWRLIDV